MLKPLRFKRLTSILSAELNDTLAMGRKMEGGDKAGHEFEMPVHEASQLLLAQKEAGKK